MTDQQVEPPEHSAEGAVEDERIAAFWQAARGHVGFGKLDSVLGESPEDVVPPPSWSYGDDAEADVGIVFDDKDFHVVDSGSAKGRVREKIRPPPSRG